MLPPRLDLSIAEFGQLACCHVDFGDLVAVLDVPAAEAVDLVLEDGAAVTPLVVFDARVLPAKVLASERASKDGLAGDVLLRAAAKEVDTAVEEFERGEAAPLGACGTEGLAVQ